MAIKKSPTSKAAAMKKRLESLYKELSTPTKKGSKSLGTTLSSDFTASGKNRARLQKEFNELSKEYKKIRGGAESTRKAAPALKTSPAKKPAAAKPAAKPAAAKKPSGKGFSQAFKEARAKFDAGIGGTTFKFNGSSYSVAKPAELKAAGGKYGPKLTKLLKAKQRRSETDKQVTNKPKSKSPFAGMPREKMLNRLAREEAAKKSYGDDMKKKTAKRKTGSSMKPKGVGVAMRGYGGAMVKKGK